MEYKRDFKGVWVSKEIWLDERLSALEKFIFVEIDSLDSEENGCFASNEYLAKFCQCSETKVSNAINKLIKLGYIFVKSFDGRQRVLQSRLTKIVRQGYKICKADLQKVQDNNIYYNTKLDKETSKESFSLTDLIPKYIYSEKVATAIKTWLDYKKERKDKKYTERGFRMLLDDLRKDMEHYSEQYVIDEINNSIKKGYMGIYPSKETTNFNKPKKQEFMKHEYSQEVLRQVDTETEFENEPTVQEEPQKKEPQSDIARELAELEKKTFVNVGGYTVRLD